MKKKADAKGYVKLKEITVGYRVLLRQKKKNKLSTMKRGHI